MDWFLPRTLSPQRQGQKKGFQWIYLLRLYQFDSICVCFLWFMCAQRGKGLTKGKVWTMNCLCAFFQQGLFLHKSFRLLRPAPLRGSHAMSFEKWPQNWGSPLEIGPCSPPRVSYGKILDLWSSQKRCCVRMKQTLVCERIAVNGIISSLEVVFSSLSDVTVCQYLRWRSRIIR